MTVSDADWFSPEAATFGDRLAGAREAAGLTQKDFADRLGVKHGVIANWEDDIKEPRANRLQMMAGLLGVSLSWLLTGEGEGPDAPSDDAPISGDLIDLLAEMRVLRAQIVRSGEKLGQLEKRLRAAVKEQL
ncbi:MAG: helix-turn-helix transcriptional regulator [Pseudomonadota bacterium]